MRHEEFLIAHRDLYGDYHNHKEQMAYAATAVYLAGAAWLIFAPADVALRPDRVLMLAFVLVTGVAAFIFVAWQLTQRRFAAEVVEACERLLARTVSGGTQALRSDPRTYNGLLMPHFLVDELGMVKEFRGPFRGTRVPEFVTYATMLAAAGLVVALLFS